MRKTFHSRLMIAHALAIPLLSRAAAAETMQQIEDARAPAQPSNTLVLSAREPYETPRAMTVRSTPAPSVIPSSVSKGAARQMRRNQTRLPTKRGRR